MGKNETSTWNWKPFNVFKLLDKQYAQNAYTISNSKHEIKQSAHTPTQSQTWMFNWNLKSKNTPTHLHAYIKGVVYMIYQYLL